MANDNNMDIDSDIREEGSLNVIKKYVKIGNSVNAVNSLKVKESIYELQFCLG